MSVTLLHISDLHTQGGDSYDRDVVLRTLVAFVKKERDMGVAPQLIFFTGDIANSGKAAEYRLATTFFDDLLNAAGLSRRELFLVPGNHDVDRQKGNALLRTIDNGEKADDYFNPNAPLLHLTTKQKAFIDWYNKYYKGIRALSRNTTCGPIEVVPVGGQRIAVLPINSALFSQGDDDENKLWIGRRCLDAAREKLQKQHADLTIALLHHPLNWLHVEERANIKNALQAEADLILCGHLHEHEVEAVISTHGNVFNFTAGAVYQTRKYPNRIFSCTLDKKQLNVRPLCYQDKPHEAWTLDPSLFPWEPNYIKAFHLPHLKEPEYIPEMTPLPSPPPRSNIPARLKTQPFVGRKGLITEILKRLENRSEESVLVLHGHSGVGKSELACEVARRLRQHYPGGAFLIDAGPAGAFLEFARIGEAILGQVFPVDMGIPDRCKFVFYSLYNTPTLLIYDNVQSYETVQPWLPMTGMSCHVLITTPCERLSPYLPSLEVPRLSPGEAWHLITEITGGEVAEKYGDRLIELADGLPVQLYPQAWALAAGNQRDHFDPGQLALTQEAKTSFHGVVALLDEKAQLLLHAASFLTGQHIPREELFQQLASAFAWTETDFHHELDACQHLHLLEGKGELRMHQLLAAYLRDLPGDDVRPALTAIRVAQHQRFIGLAHELITVQANATRAARFLVYPLTIEAWKERNETFSIEESETLGNALSEIGRFAEAFPWYQRAVEVREHVDGQKDYARLSGSLHNLGYCLSSQGQFNEARAWFERAVAARQHPDCHGCIDQEGLGRSLHEVGNCLSSLGFFAEAQGWFERAVKARELGDLHGHIDLEGLGRSLYEVGNCLSSRGQFIEAQPWYLRAVEARQQGELHGGVDQESLGWSLHGMAFCLSSQQQFAEAQKWYERAVTAKEQGDIHGRVDHEGLGRSLHEIGYCVSSQGHYVEAQSWYEQAVVARQRGDVYGRVDYEGCGCSLHEVGNCLANQHRYAEAQEWFERAMKIRLQGDLYRRVDQEGRGCSLHSLGYCLSSREQYTEAQKWFEQAVAAREQGDIYGHVNYDGLGCSLHEMGYCLSCQGRYTEAFSWLARAVEAKRQGDALGQINATSLTISLREAARYLRLLARHDEAQKWEEEAEQLLGN